LKYTLTAIPAWEKGLVPSHPWKLTQIHAVFVHVGSVERTACNCGNCPDIGIAELFFLLVDIHQGKKRWYQLYRL
jgi:hypothetical protein